MPLMRRGEMEDAEEALPHERGTGVMADELCELIAHGRSVLGFPKEGTMQLVQAAAKSCWSNGLSCARWELLADLVIKLSSSIAWCD